MDGDYRVGLVDLFDCPDQDEAGFVLEGCHYRVNEAAMGAFSNPGSIQPNSLVLRHEQSGMMLIYDIVIQDFVDQSTLEGSYIGANGPSLEHYLLASFTKDSISLAVGTPAGSFIGHATRSDEFESVFGRRSGVKSDLLDDDYLAAAQVDFPDLFLDETPEGDREAGGFARELFGEKNRRLLRNFFFDPSYWEPSSNTNAGRLAPGAFGGGHVVDVLFWYSASMAERRDLVIHNVGLACAYFNLAVFNSGSQSGARIVALAVEQDPEEVELMRPYVSGVKHYYDVAQIYVFTHPFLQQEITAALWLNPLGFQAVGAGGVLELTKVATRMRNRANEIGADLVFQFVDEDLVTRPSEPKPGSVVMGSHEGGLALPPSSSTGNPSYSYGIISLDLKNQSNEWKAVNDYSGTAHELGHLFGMHHASEDGSCHAHTNATEEDVIGTPSKEKLHEPPSLASPICTVFSNTARWCPDAKDDGWHNMLTDPHIRVGDIGAIDMEQLFAQQCRQAPICKGGLGNQPGMKSKDFRVSGSGEKDWHNRGFVDPDSLYNTIMAYDDSCHRLGLDSCRAELAAFSNQFGGVDPHGAPVPLLGTSQRFPPPSGDGGYYVARGQACNPVSLIDLAQPFDGATCAVKGGQTVFGLESKCSAIQLGRDGRNDGVVDSSADNILIFDRLAPHIANYRVRNIIATVYGEDRTWVDWRWVNPGGEVAPGTQSPASVPDVELQVAASVKGTNPEGLWLSVREPPAVSYTNAVGVGAGAPLALFNKRKSLEWPVCGPEAGEPPCSLQFLAGTGFARRSEWRTIDASEVDFEKYGAIIDLWRFSGGKFVLAASSVVPPLAGQLVASCDELEGIREPGAFYVQGTCEVDGDRLCRLVNGELVCDFEDNGLHLLDINVAAPNTSAGGSLHVASGSTWWQVDGSIPLVEYGAEVPGGRKQLDRKADLLVRGTAATMEANGALPVPVCCAVVDNPYAPSIERLSIVAGEGNDHVSLTSSDFGDLRPPFRGQSLEVFVELGTGISTVAGADCLESVNCTPLYREIVEATPRAGESLVYIAGATRNAARIFSGDGTQEFSAIVSLGPGEDFVQIGDASIQVPEAGISEQLVWLGEGEDVACIVNVDDVVLQDGSLSGADVDVDRVGVARCEPRQGLIRGDYIELGSNDLCDLSSINNGPGCVDSVFSQESQSCQGSLPQSCVFAR